MLLPGGGVGFAGIVRWTGLARFGHGFTLKCFATSRKAPSRISRVALAVTAYRGRCSRLAI